MFEYYNPQVHAISALLHQPIGSVRILPGEYVPSPAMEKKGLTADLFLPFVQPSLLHKTPPARLRELIEAEGGQVPKNLEAATRHLGSFKKAGKKAPASPPLSLEEVRRAQRAAADEAPDEAKEIASMASSWKEGKTASPNP